MLYRLSYGIKIYLSKNEITQLYFEGRKDISILELGKN